MGRAHVGWLASAGDQTRKEHPQGMSA